MIVFLTQMAEPHMLETLCHVLGKGYTAILVAEMARYIHYPFLKMCGIRTVLEHLLVVVGLDDEIVGIGDMGLYLGGNLARVGDNAEGDAVVLYLESHIVGTVVGHSEGGDLKLAHLIGDALLNRAL